ncbi:MAG: Gfo/Idh/MocA family oxidoreductase [Phycisphaerae bacterium]|nr:Gfo/Idh/MocA family oxidoreductase [Phycisphaerae bacterium]
MSERIIGVGVIGIGLRGQHSYEQGLSRDPRVKVVAVSSYPDIDQAVREGRSDDDDRRYAEGFEADFYGDDYKKLLEREDVHLVSLMCEPSRALELGRACFAAGKHVFRDKPVTKTATEAMALQRAADQADHQLILGLPLRYHSPLVEAQKKIAGGTIGDLLAITMSYIWASGPLEGFTASAGYLDAYGGGDVTTAGFHAIDYLNWLIDSSPVSVYCEQDTFFYEDYRKVGMEDFGQLVITYDNGVIATLITGRVPKRSGQTSWLDITGTAGAIEVRDLFPSIRIGGETTTRIPFYHDPLSALCKETVDYLLCDRSVPANASDGASVLAVLEAARHSAANHHVEVVDLTSYNLTGTRE